MTECINLNDYKKESKKWISTCAEMTKQVAFWYLKSMKLLHKIAIKPKKKRPHKPSIWELLNEVICLFVVPFHDISSPFVLKMISKFTIIKGNLWYSDATFTPSACNLHCIRTRWKLHADAILKKKRQKRIKKPQ